MTATPVFGPLELTGRTRRHVVELTELHCALHRSVVNPFLAMRAAAAQARIDLAPASAFRDFELQVRIWNEKWLGRRALRDRSGRRLEASDLTPARRVAAILAWSAPPGASRHHWGTEIDVFDRAALPAGSRLELVAAEYAAGGPFARLTQWLDVHMERFGFYRPYATDRGGVAPEPWHLSYAPTSREASRRLRLATVRAAIAAGEIEGKAALLRALPRIYARYVRAVDLPRRSSR
jgi:LAS superfamily LD-carboxypeptidase LdcB